ncbi:hypothetical protein LCGC14_1169450 [marine sediment metagenome]|uniref:Uncharacterized protein n=1 Tax=marine sediment metagenome TaxID=412755 RepID=A0A0F9P8H7_9ZZZZ
MPQFIVKVFTRSTRVTEQKKELVIYDISATVDGEVYRYLVVKAAQFDKVEDWRGRGVQQAYYHAKNSGANVKFHEVHYVPPKRKSKIPAKQMSLFE